MGDGFFGKFDAVKDTYTLFIILLAWIGVGSAWLIGSEAGKIFFGITLIAITGLYITFQFIRENEEDIDIPLRDNVVLSAGLFLSGHILIILINFIVGFFNKDYLSYNIYKPLAVFSTASLSKVSIALSLETQKFYSWFFTAFSAGTLEDFVFRYAGFVIVFVLLGFLLKMLKFDFSESTTKWIKVIGAMILLSLLFMYTHKLNGSYVANPQFFWFAFVFSLLMFVLIYFFRYGLVIAIGLHIGNNSASLGWADSVNSVIQGIQAGNPLAYTITIFYLVSIIVVLSNLPYIWRMMRGIND